MKQVITISPDGGMSGLQRKRGQGIDLRQFGHAKITRASSIEWHEDLQHWYIKVLDPNVSLYVNFKGLPFTVTYDIWRHQVGESKPKGSVTIPVIMHRANYLYFQEYEDAVAAEVQFLDAVRLRQGYSVD